LNARLLSRLETASQRSIRKQELHEVLRKDIGSTGGERVHVVHLNLIVDTNGNDVACGDRLEVDLVVRLYHAKGFLDPQVECTVHTLSNMLAQGAEMTHHRTPGLHFAFLDALARLEGHGPQLF
jgi:hypothetical protein